MELATHASHKLASLLKRIKTWRICNSLFLTKTELQTERLNSNTYSLTYKVPSDPSIYQASVEVLRRYTLKQPKSTAGTIMSRQHYIRPQLLPRSSSRPYFSSRLSRPLLTVKGRLQPQSFTSPPHPSHQRSPSVQHQTELTPRQHLSHACISIARSGTLS